MLLVIIEYIKCFIISLFSNFGRVKLSDMEMCEIESSTDENSGQNDDQIKRDLIYTFDCPCGDTFLVSNADLCLDKSNNSNYFDCLSCSHKLCVLIDK